MPTKQKSSRSRSGKPEALPGFVNTVTELAKAVGQSPRVVHGWLKSGCPGRSQHGFSVAAVKKWHWMEEASDEELRIAAEQAESELAEMVLAERLRLLARSASAMQSILSQLPDQVLKHLPKMPPVDRKRFHAALVTEVAPASKSIKVFLSSLERMIAKKKPRAKARSKK